MEFDNTPLRSGREVAKMMGLSGAYVSHLSRRAIAKMRLAWELLDDGEPLEEVSFVVHAWSGKVGYNRPELVDGAIDKLDKMSPDKRPAAAKYRMMFGDSEQGMWTNGT